MNTIPRWARPVLALIAGTMTVPVIGGWLEANWNNPQSLAPLFLLGCVWFTLSALWLLAARALLRLAQVRNERRTDRALDDMEDQFR